MFYPTPRGKKEFGKVKIPLFKEKNKLVNLSPFEFEVEPKTNKVMKTKIKLIDDEYKKGIPEAKKGMKYEYEPKDFKENQQIELTTYELKIIYNLLSWIEQYDDDSGIKKITKKIYVFLESKNILMP